MKCELKWNIKILGFLLKAEFLMSSTDIKPDGGQYQHFTASHYYILHRPLRQFYNTRQGKNISGMKYCMYCITILYNIHNIYITERLRHLADTLIKSNWDSFQFNIISIYTARYTLKKCK